MGACSRYFRSMKKLLVVLLMVLAVANVWAQKLTPTDFSAAITDKESIQLVDVRTPEEFNKGHIKGASNIDIRGAFDKGVSSLKKDQPVYVYCLSGGRSAAAARKMKASGFTTVIDLSGGIIAWNNAGLPLEGNGSLAVKGTSRSEYDKLVSGAIPVLVDFYAPWCAPCKKMSPMLKQLEADHKGKFKLVKLNADNEKALMKEMGVKEIPTFFVYKNGTRVWEHVGLETEQNLKTQLEL